MSDTARRPSPRHAAARSLAGGGAGNVPAAGLSSATVARRRAILAALSVALRAIEGGRDLTADDIDVASDLARTAFGPGSAIGFALGMVLFTRIEGGDLPARGRELGRAIERASWPEIGERVDVWG